MNEQQQLADLIRRLQAEGMGLEELAGALVEGGVRLSEGSPVLDLPGRDERIAMMVRYASNILRKPGSVVTQTFHQASPDVRHDFEEHFRRNLEGNPYFYLGMQTTGELVRAVGEVPELAAAYGRMTPQQRSVWVGQMRDAWHAFAQAAEAFGLPKL